ncbi:MAG: hypothetical protein WCT05_11720 [Lentisphaeria bacterium]
MKSLFVFISCFLLIGGLFGQDFPAPEWVRVMTDRGDSGSRWYMVSSPRRQAVKTLQLDFPASELAGAALEYYIQTEPYDPKLKQHINAEVYPWAHFLVKINDQIIIDQPANPYIRKGVHQIPFPPEKLRQGENIISMSWMELPEGNPQQLRYGYIYFSQDLTENKTTKEPENLRIRLLLRFDDCHSNTSAR